jgi:hypothetical protein
MVQPSQELTMLINLMSFQQMVNPLLSYKVQVMVLVSAITLKTMKWIMLKQPVKRKNRITNIFKLRVIFNHLMVLGSNPRH